MQRIIVVAALAIGTAAAQCQVDAKHRRVDVEIKVPEATIHIQVYTAWGGRIHKEQAHLILAREQGEVILNCSGASQIADVPYDSYLLTVWDDGGGSARRRLIVNTKEPWLRVGLHFPAGDTLWPSGNLTVSGEIHPAPSGKDWWVRVSGVFLDERKESPISRNGEFSVDGLDMGTYLVEIFEHAQLRHAESVEIDSNRPNTHIRISVPSPLEKR